MFEQRELESAGNEAEAMAEESNAFGEFEQKDKYSISTIVDVGNDAYKAGVKAERSRMREVVEGAITWQDYMWPQTTQSKEEMSRYQTGKITKEEHEDQRKVVFDEEFAIYKKAEKDTKRAILKAMED